MASDSTLNGINTNDLDATLDAVKSDPTLANFKFCAQNKWVDGFHGQTEIGHFTDHSGNKVQHKTTFEFHADEPPALLGLDAGPNATEALLHALASCLNATLIYHATLKGVKIDSLSFDMEGDLDVNGFLGTSMKERNGFKAIRVKCTIKADAPKETLQHLCELAQKHSPVFDMVTNPTSVEVSLSID